MPVGLKQGNGRCGYCGTRMKEMTKDGSVLVSCDGCGVVCGEGEDARKVIDDYVAAGKATRIDAAPGFHAMRVIGGPSA